jgi:hypothetical protein
MADESYVAVYVGWTTFKNAVESLVQGIPNQIDRTTFPGQSGGVQNQLFTAFKFLGLTTDEGKPTAALQNLAVPDESARKGALKALLQERYADLFALDLTKTTPKQLSDTMTESYRVTGDTREKAVRWFLQAAAYVGVPLSRYLPVPGVSATNGGSTKTKPRRATTKAKSDAGNAATPPRITAGATGTERTISLHSGGTLTLSAAFDPWELSEADRGFVFSLIDKLKKYESEQEKEKADDADDLT